MKEINIGLLSAMPEEIGKTLNNFDNLSKKKFGDLEIFSGEWINELKDTKIKLTIAWSGWGKVSAARAATRLISESKKLNKLDLLLFTGVAGSLSKNLKQWDIVLPHNLIQYDMDASPLFEKYEIPALKKKYLKPTESWHKKIYQSLKSAKDIGQLKEFGNVNKGLIGTADRFISKTEDIKKIKKSIPKICAIEMEGAAIAQIAEQENIPYSILRVISDESDESASENFGEFISKYNNYSWELLKIIFLDL